MDTHEITPRDTITREFWTTVGNEIDRILNANNMVVINSRTKRDQDMPNSANEVEWPQLPDRYRTDANMEFVSLVRIGQVQTIDITTPVARATRQTRDKLMREVLNPQEFNMVRQTLNQDTTSNDHENLKDDIRYRENNEELTES